jgi:hypothetical protein
MTLSASLLVETNGMLNLKFKIKRKEIISINFLQLDFIGYPISSTNYVHICGLIEGV